MCDAHSAAVGGMAMLMGGIESKADQREGVGRENVYAGSGVVAGAAIASQRFWRPAAGFEDAGMPVLGQV